MNPQDSKIICPDCKNEITKPEGMSVGDIVECQECGTEVEIQLIDPLVYGELTEESRVGFNFAKANPATFNAAIDEVDNVINLFDNKKNVFAIVLSNQIASVGFVYRDFFR